MMDKRRVVETEMFRTDIGLWKVVYVLNDGSIFEFLTDNEDKALKAYSEPPESI